MVELNQARAVAVTKVRLSLRQGDRIALPSLYPAQQQIKGEARRFNVLDIGRRAGKTYLGQHLALETALAGHPVGWFAPNYKYLLEVWQEVTRMLRSLSSKINATERRIELVRGGGIEFWTLDGTDDPGRSRKYKRVIVDEAAMVAHLKTVWEEAIRPTLTDLEGDAWFLSTPQGLNYFYELFQRGADTEAYPGWRSWQMPSSVNPFLPAAEIEAARQELPELVFKQEYLAEFLQNAGAVFRNVDACLSPGSTLPSDHKGHGMVAGVDWGRQHDFTAISILCCHCAREVALDRFNQLGWEFQRGRLLGLLLKWGVTHVEVESNSIGSPNLEALRDIAPDSISLRAFETTAKSKPKLIQALALAFEKAELRWVDDPVARHELIAYEASVTDTGYIKYGAPESGWDDTVIARALAYRATRGNIPVPLTPDEEREAQLPERLRRGAVAEAVASATPSEAWRYETPRKLALAEIEEAERRRRRHSDPLSAFDEV